MQLIFHECDKRELALMQIRAMPFNSPSPVAFFRQGHGILPGIPCADIDHRKSRSEKRPQEYRAHEYLELLLRPDFDSGATGQVHKATIRITLSDGQQLSSPAIVKIAFHDFQRKRLRHEYAVYKHLAKKGVKCVVSIYGLFDDGDDESSALIMSDAGISLYDRELKRDPGKIPVEQVSVTREERSAFLIIRMILFTTLHPREIFKQALSEIHRAGVRHYDIRPMNLLIDDDGKATVVDFDMAKMGAGRHSREREFDDLCRLLQGSYSPPNEYPSNATTQSSLAHSDSLEDP